MSIDNLTDQLAKLSSVATEITEKLYTTATENAPETVDLILSVYRFDGIASIVLGAIALLIMLGSTYYLSRKVDAYNTRGYRWFDNSEGAVLLILIPYFVGLVASVCINFLNIWNWAAAIEPKLYLAHILLSKIGG